MSDDDNVITLNPHSVELLTDDPVDALIFHLRYHLGWSWHKISQQFNGQPGTSRYQCRRRFIATLALNAPPEEVKEHRLEMDAHLEHILSETSSDYNALPSLEECDPKAILVLIKMRSELRSELRKTVKQLTDLWGAEAPKRFRVEVTEDYTDLYDEVDRAIDAARDALPEG